MSTLAEVALLRLPDRCKGIFELNAVSAPTAKHRHDLSAVLLRARVLCLSEHPSQPALVERHRPNERALWQEEDSAKDRSVRLTPEVSADKCCFLSCELPA